MWEDIQMECFPFSWRVVWWRLSFFYIHFHGIKLYRIDCGERIRSFRKLITMSFWRMARSMNWRRMCAWGDERPNIAQFENIRIKEQSRTFVRTVNRG